VGAKRRRRESNGRNGVPRVRTHKFRSFGALTALGALGALTVLAGCSSSSSSGHAATTSAPAKAALTYTTLNLGLPQQALNAPVTGNVPASEMLHVNVTLKVNAATLNKLGKNVKSPSAGAQNLAKQLGVSDADIAKIQQYFATGHVQAKANKTHTNVTFDITAGTAGRLLQTTFVTHKLNGRSYFTPAAAQPPKIPTQIAGYILAVTGLDSYSIPPQTGMSPMAPPAMANIRPAASGRCVNFYPRIASPAKIAKAYGYDQMWAKGWHGEGVTVNLVEIDGYRPSDVSTYVSCIGSKATLQNVNMGAQAPAPGPEATLDIEMLSGLAPGVRMVDYQEDPAQGASWSAFNEALQQIIDDNQGNSRPGSIVSISLGGPEDQLTNDVMAAVNQNLSILTEAEHMTVFVASGDCGAYQDGQYGGHPNVGFPASSPEAVAVGGTRMAFSANGTRTGESVWSDRSNLSKCGNAWGSDGGVSQVFARPEYQQAKGVPYANGHRDVPDVSAAAIQIPVELGGQWVSMGGTSAAAPIWAAGMSLVNQGLINTKRYFYFGPRTFYDIANAAGNQRPYYDVTRGNNLYYPATPGYDEATGLGTPQDPQIYSILYNAREF
jgi:kumamolisin